MVTINFSEYSILFIFC
ncbi:hypothetical protein Gogos_000630 [Gossypium gossypioides]|uniref:Uncharacterized protein n=1 Tax=Gossypium gossypioides TaxID=34282 RepID=A0A7J9CTE7_GOSGO|nr:hypothetical protein [Gossypium gossypioides]